VKNVLIVDMNSIEEVLSVLMKKAMRTGLNGSIIVKSVTIQKVLGDKARKRRNLKI
jgi:hypothetical protein